MQHNALLLAVLLLAGGVAADSISEQDQIYIVSGILGAVCLLLTIAAIVCAITVIKLQTQVAVLQAGTSGESKMLVDPPRQQQQQAGPSKGEELNRHGVVPHEDPYRAPSRDIYNMGSRPVPPPRPRVGPSGRENGNYY